MIRLKHNGAYHTIASANDDNARTTKRVDFDCGESAPQPIVVTTELVAPEELCPGCDKVRMNALEYFAVQVEARAG